MQSRYRNSMARGWFGSTDWLTLQRKTNRFMCRSTRGWEKGGKSDRGWGGGRNVQLNSDDLLYDPHLPLVPQQVVFRKVRVNQLTLGVHFFHDLQTAHNTPWSERKTQSRRKARQGGRRKKHTAIGCTSYPNSFLVRLLPLLWTEHGVLQFRTGLLIFPQETQN